MSKNLVIVESPAKAKTIANYLGKDFVVKSSMGHIRDLDKGDDAINIKLNFLPKYIISPEKKDTVKDLKKAAKEADEVWLATDEDREGEAISWHLAEVLDLDVAKTKRIVFHEITKKAIQKAVDNPRTIDMNLVDAQQARRILDRLVGFELSPVLWKKVKPSLSAGRVQSVAVRLIVEREREINNFQSKSDYRISALFDVTDDAGKTKILKAELSQKYSEKGDAEKFLQSCIGANYTIKNIEKKPAKRSPSAPFTTSTLQQEAARKNGLPVGVTMQIAQKLYEAGHITYMRTDSVNLSDDALAAAEKEITSQYGNKYHKLRKFQTKTSGAQEAHEAIRPTDFSVSEITGTSQEEKLYQLIWKRAIASQMSEAEFEKTIASIEISTNKNILNAEGEVLMFDGFLKVYIESSDDENDEDTAGMLPPIKIGQQLPLNEMNAVQKFSRPAPRYAEASLVKKLEELGIGRPSTYAPTISTIQKRGYVIKEDREGKERAFEIFSLKKDVIKSEIKKENYGAERAKLFPSDIGSVVTDFLLKHFGNIMDYGFTAAVEEEFDEIAEGKIKWNKMLDKFYNPFHKTVEKTNETADREQGERELGIDPVTNKKVTARIGRYGPLVQIGNEETDGAKPRFANLRGGQLIETITLEEALELFKLPRVLGAYEGKDIKANVGRFGPYVQFDKLFASLPKDENPETITFERAIEIILAKQKSADERLIKKFDNDPEILIQNGRYGVYFSIGKNNYKIPKDTDPKTLTKEKCLEMAAEQDAAPKKKFVKRGKK